MVGQVKRVALLTHCDFRSREESCYTHVSTHMTKKNRTSKATVPEKNPAAVALSKLGASKGGHARAAKLSRTARRRIAKLAARARWHKN